MVQARPGGPILPVSADVDTRSEPEVSQGPGAVLDLDKGIAHAGVYVDPRLGRGCQRWPEGQHLFNETTGELYPGRCRATNLCPYCRALYVIETVQMLCLDAAEYSPTLWLVLTAREHLTRRECSAHVRVIRQALKRSWPAIEWFTQVEFQGRGALHLNLLVKGVAVEDRRELEREMVGRWCARVDALPVGQWSGEISAAEGLYRYLQKTLAHGLKAEQAPPLGWKGHRTSQTRGYLVRPASVMREEARAALRVSRALWRAKQAGMDAEEAEALVQRESALREAAVIRLRHVRLGQRAAS